MAFLLKNAAARCAHLPSGGRASAGGKLRVFAFTSREHARFLNRERLAIS